MINSEEFIKFQVDQEQFAAQYIELYMRYLKRDSRSSDIAFDKEMAKLTSMGKEHSDTYIEGIQPVFVPLKARRFDSSWNWVHQDALVMYYDIIFGRLTTVDRLDAFLFSIVQIPTCSRTCNTISTNAMHRKVTRTSRQSNSTNSS